MRRAPPGSLLSSAPARRPRVSPMPSIMQRTFSSRLRSLAGGVAGALLSITLAACDRGPAPPGPVVLIGVDGLSWNVLLPLVHEGRVPHLEALMRQGVAGRLATLEPTVSPTIWTTIATGRGPDAHGVRHFVQTDPESGEQVPVTSNVRRVPALWNILSAWERRVGVVGWWVTWPAEPVNGVLVSSYSRPVPAAGLWKGRLYENLPEQTWPRELFADLKPLLEEELERLDESTAAIFPTLARRRGLRVAQLEQSKAAFLADRVFTATAVAVLERQAEPFDFFAVYLNGVDVVGHRFWKFYRPQDFQYEIPEPAVQTFGPIIPDYVAEVDRLVGRILAAAQQQGGTVLVVSDHGMHAAAGAVKDPKKGMSGHHTDAPDGVLLAAGPLIRRAGGEGDGAGRPLPTAEEDLPRVGTVFDVAPTVLYLQGVPLSEELEGRVMERLLLPGLLDRHPPAATGPYPFDRPAGDGQAIATQMDEALKEQLRALGYI